MSNKQEIYNRSKLDYQKIFTELHDSINSFDYDERNGCENILLKKVLELEEMTGLDNYTQDSFETLSDKKVLFEPVIDNLKLNLISLASNMSDIERQSLYEKVTYMQAYVKNLTLHILNCRAYNTPYNVPIDEFTLNITSKLIALNRSTAEPLFDSLESCLTKSDDVLVLLMSLLNSIDESTINSEETSNENHSKTYFRELFFNSYQYLTAIDLDYNLTKGLDRDKSVAFNEYNLLDTNDGLEINKIKASDIDYKFYEDDTKIDEKSKKSIGSEFLKKHGFGLEEVDRVMESLLANIVTMTCKTKKEWIQEINKLNVTEIIAERVFCFFSYKRDTGSDVELTYSSFITNKKKIDEAIFLEISENQYATSPTLISWGWRLFQQLLCNSPWLYIGTNKVIDKISDSFCDEVESILVAEFKGITVIKNFYLNEVCKSDCEIDVLAIYNGNIIILECKRLGFTRDPLSAKNQKKQLQEKSTKQLSNEIAAVKSNLDRIIEYIAKKHSNVTSNQKYNISGYIVTKEISYAHFNKNTDHILHVKQLVNHLTITFERSANSENSGDTIFNY